MNPDDLRIALFSGNYNYVRDGANQALNRLVGYLLRQGAQVRIYSPIRANPAFATAYENLGDVYARLAGQAYARAQQLDTANATLPPKLALVRQLFPLTAKSPAKP